MGPKMPLMSGTKRRLRLSKKVVVMNFCAFRGLNNRNAALGWGAIGGVKEVKIRVKLLPIHRVELLALVDREC